MVAKYKTLQNDPVTRETWSIALGKEFVNMAQGDVKTNTPGTNSIFVLTHEQIRNIPKGRVVTYARLLVDFIPQKKDPNRVRMMAGGNLTKYLGKLTTQTANLTTSKILRNSVLSTENAKYMCLDISNFYLGTPLGHYEYMWIPLASFPEHTKEQYNMQQHTNNGFVYV